MFELKKKVTTFQWFQTTKKMFKKKSITMLQAQNKLSRTIAVYFLK